MPATVLSLENVSKTFNKKVAVDEVTLSLQQGEIFGFLGPNGAGKTTTIRMIMGFIAPNTGSLKIFGKSLVGKNSSLLNKVGYLSADSALYPTWTASRHIDFVESVRGKAGAKDSLIKRLDLDLNTPYHKLSTGNKQKLALTLAMMNEPKLLILDEPTRGLDPLLQQEIYGLLEEFKNSGGTVFMSSHNLSEVQKSCDKVAIIRSGKIVASETLDTLREKNIHQISIEFANKVNMDKLNLKNVDIVKQHQRTLIVNVHGDLNEFLQKVTTHRLVDISISHLSLEELFMRYYK